MIKWILSRRIIKLSELITEGMYEVQLGEFIFYVCSLGDRMRQRRRRTLFTAEQLDRLEESFMEEKFPGIIIR